MPLLLQVILVLVVGLVGGRFVGWYLAEHWRAVRSVLASVFMFAGAALVLWLVSH
jgi:hypothetical protein